MAIKTPIITDEEIAALENALKEGKELADVRIVKKGEGVIKEKGKEKSDNDETAAKGNKKLQRF